MLSQKSIFARLLANENITVSEGNYPTAFFDLKKRILAIPNWSDVSNDAYDMLVGHEVSHALYTPPKEYSEAGELIGVPQSWVNVIEDIRIEKLIQRKYPGLVTNFRRGYADIFADKRDIFGIQKKDIQNLPFIDRINLKAKARDLLDVKFTKKEQCIFDALDQMETFDDVLDGCRMVKAYYKKDFESVSVGDAFKDILEQLMAEIAENTELRAPTPAESMFNAYDQEYREDYEPQEIKESITDDSFQTSIGDLRSNGMLLVRGPRQNDIDKIITPATEVLKERYIRVGLNGLDTNYDAQRAYNMFIKSNIGYVNALAKEFEMRKAAYRMKRARVSTKGSLDVDKLHKYKHDEYLFKQVTRLADAKNHGMIVCIDNSSSMNGTIDKVIRQALILAMFCKKVNIPFRIMSFTDWWRRENMKHMIPSIAFSRLGLTELLTSDMTKKEYRDAFRGLFGRTTSFRYMTEFERMHGTPLSETLIALRTICMTHRRKYNLDRVSMILLTDGEGGGLSLERGTHDMENLQHYRDGIKLMYEDVSVKINSRDYLSVRRAILKQMKLDGVDTVWYYVGDKYTLNYKLDSMGLNQKTRQEKQSKLDNDGIASITNAADFDKVFLIKTTALNSRGAKIDLDSDDADAISSALSDYTKKNVKVMAKEFALSIA